jgi:hypothetical protein
VCIFCEKDVRLEVRVLSGREGVCKRLGGGIADRGESRASLAFPTLLQDPSEPRHHRILLLDHPTPPLQLQELTCGTSDDPSPTLLLRELLHQVVGAAQFEGEDGGEILAFEEDLSA